MEPFPPQYDNDTVRRSIDQVTSQLTTAIRASERARALLGELAGMTGARPVGMALYDAQDAAESLERGKALVEGIAHQYR